MSIQSSGCRHKRILLLYPSAGAQGLDLGFCWFRMLWLKKRQTAYQQEDSKTKKVLVKAGLSSWGTARLCRFRAFRV